MATKKSEAAGPEALARPSYTCFQFRDLISKLRSDPAWARSGRNAMTLKKGPNLGVVLTALRKGTEVHEHRARGPITVQVLEGRIRMRLGSESVELGAGDLFVCDASIGHSVEPLEDSVFLLTLAEPFTA